MGEGSITLLFVFNLMSTIVKVRERDFLNQHPLKHTVSPKMSMHH